MDDLEMTRLCAEAMGIDYFSGTEVVSIRYPRGDSDIYDPLHDDAQAMALVKKLRLRVEPPTDDWPSWAVFEGGEYHKSLDENLNRAIVECVANMQRAKNG